MSAAAGLPALRHHNSHNNTLFTLTSGWKIGLVSPQQRSKLDCVYLPHTHTPLPRCVKSQKPSQFEVQCDHTSWHKTCETFTYVCVWGQRQTLKEVVTLLQGLMGNLVWWTDRRTDRQVTSDNVSDRCHGDRKTVASVWDLWPPHLWIACNVSVWVNIIGGTVKTWNAKCVR